MGLYRGYRGIMENQMGTTVMGYIYILCFEISVESIGLCSNAMVSC